MNPQALRIALRQPEAWATLTDHQRKVVRMFVETPNISAIARALSVSRQAVMKALRLAGKKFLAFAETLSR